MMPADAIFIHKLPRDRSHILALNFNESELVFGHILTSEFWEFDQVTNGTRKNHMRNKLWPKSRKSAK